MSKIQKPALLAYNRSLVPTDGIFKSLIGGIETPVPVIVKGTLGTESQYHEQNGKEKEYGNPQRVDSASLPAESDTLLIEWSLNVVAESLRPHACNVPAWRRALINLATTYGAAGNYRELGARYAVNIANGRWAWKNRLFASDFTVEVRIDGENAVAFDAFAVPMDDFDAALAGARGQAIRDLGNRIGDALAGVNGARLLRIAVRGILKMVPGSVVYPSQEFPNGEDDGDKTGVKKFLYSRRVAGESRCAAFHEQKIGNALRTVDTWHGGVNIDGDEYLEDSVPLAVNPYAQAREEFVVARPRASGRDLYTLLEKGFPTFVGLTTDETHFVMTNLVRGGVFNMK